ncbi:MAG: sulfatase-like hydrolase/transferase [Planctomycetota bacterium]|jgi:arylsulfatase A-like enzyme
MRIEKDTESTSMNRRQFLSAAGVGLASVMLGRFGSAEARQTVDRPNVIFFFSDTHRWGAMSYTQTPAVQTPFMVQMKNSGVSMDRCYSNLPICSPYRGILMSGRWPWEQGIMANHMRLDDRPDMTDKFRGTLVWMFKDAGYNTGYFGKSHWGGNDLRPFGFDKCVVWNGTNNHMQCTYRENGGPKQNWMRGTSDDSNCTPTVTQALDWVDLRHDDPEPFFVMISVNPPHGKMTDAPDGKKALYPNSTVLPFHPHDELQQFDDHQGYHAHVSDVDDEIGRILAKMTELGIANNTIFIYSSDHGGMSGVRRISYGQKRNPEDEATRLPFLVVWPGTISANVQLDVLFSTIDHFPTICGLANVANQLNRAGTPNALESLAYLNACPGLDFSKNILAQPGGPVPESIFIMHPSNMNNGSPYQTVFRGVVTKDYTYALAPDTEYCLYDNTGQYQYPNLLGQAGYDAVRRSLWEKIRDWMKVAEEPFTDRWFAEMPVKWIKAWNKEHGFGVDNPDRKIGKQALFNIYNSKPPVSIQVSPRKTSS